MNSNGYHLQQAEDSQEKLDYECLVKRLQHSIDSKRAPLKLPTVSVMSARLGWGDNPRITKSVFKRLERSCRQHGPRAARIVWSTLKRASEKKTPVRWFVVVAMDELRAIDALAE